MFKEVNIENFIIKQEGLKNKINEDSLWLCSFIEQDLNQKKVVELGSGSGLISIFIEKNFEVKEVVSVEVQRVLNQSKGKITLRGQASKIRNHLIKKLKESALTTNEIAIVQALILGQKKDINKQLYTDYAAAGAIHILAVSGLHVGIIYFILIALLRPLKRLFKYELIISIIIVYWLIKD